MNRVTRETIYRTKYRTKTKAHPMIHGLSLQRGFASAEIRYTTEKDTQKSNERPKSKDSTPFVPDGSRYTNGRKINKAGNASTPHPFWEAPNERTAMKSAMSTVLKSGNLIVIHPS